MHFISNPTPLDSSRGVAILRLLLFSLTSPLTRCCFVSIVFGFPFPPELLALLEVEVRLLLEILSLDLFLCSVIVSQRWQDTFKSLNHE
jgi:hypothetical protein